MINQQELEAKIIELSLWSRGSFGKSCFYGQLLVDLSSFNWNKYDGLEQICRLRNLVASSSLFLTVLVFLLAKNGRKDLDGDNEK